MLYFLRNLFRLRTPRPVDAGEGRKARAVRLTAILISEMTHTQVNGRPVTHRRLDSLMLAADAGKRETMRLLRGIGARPSGRHGVKLWTRQ